MTIALIGVYHPYVFSTRMKIFQKMEKQITKSKDLIHPIRNMYFKNCVKNILKDCQTSKIPFDNCRDNLHIDFTK